MSEDQPTPLLVKNPTLVMLWPVIFTTLTLLLLYNIYSLQVYLRICKNFLKKSARTLAEMK